jgi:hypothetical protein
MFPLTHGNTHRDADTASDLDAHRIINPGCCTVRDTDKYTCKPPRTGDRESQLRDG